MEGQNRHRMRWQLYGARSRVIVVKRDASGCSKHGLQALGKHLYLCRHAVPQAFESLT